MSSEEKIENLTNEINILRRQVNSFIKTKF